MGDDTNHLARGGDNEVLFTPVAPHDGSKTLYLRLVCTITVDGLGVSI